ncbi:hypothetical protein FRC15_003487, partial [Serendipita sp. 397]
EFTGLYPRVRFAHVLPEAVTTRLAASIPGMRILAPLLRLMLMELEECAQVAYSESRPNSHAFRLTAFLEVMWLGIWTSTSLWSTGAH